MPQKWAPPSGTHQKWAPPSGTHQKWAPVASSPSGTLRAAWATFAAQDTAAPTGVAILTPSTGAVLFGSTVLVATARDNRDSIVETVQFYLDDVAIGQGVPVTGPGGTTYQVTFDTTAAWVTDGAHALSVTAIDNAGHATGSTSVAVTVRNLAPQVYYPFTGEQMLDAVPGSNMLAYTFDWQVLRRAGDLGPRIGPWKDSAPTIELQSTQKTMRQVRGMEVAAAQMADVDTNADTLQVYMRLVTGDRYPVGRFCFADITDLPGTGGEVLIFNLNDFGWKLDQGLDRTVSVKPGDSLASLLLQLAAEAGITDVLLDSAAATQSVSAPTVWAGGSSRYDAMAAICNMLGCYPPFFDGTGTLIIRTVPDLATAPMDRTYNAGPTSRIIAGTPTGTNSTYSAPNQYIVAGGTSQAPIVAVFNVPAGAPNSQARIGYPITTVIQLTSVESEAAAYGAAVAAYARDVRSFRTAQFESIIDPRHGVFDIVEYLGDPHVETGWRIDTKDGGTMQHTLSRIWLGASTVG